MGDCSEAGISGRIILTPASVCGHCSSRCGSHGPEMMAQRLSYGSPPSLTFCLARAQVLVLYAALSLAEDCHAQERVPRAYPSRNPDLTLACAASRAHDECAHFCSWTGWATQKASISSFLSCPMHGATVAALILIACSSVVESADMRLLGQGRGGPKSCVLLAGEVAGPFRWLCSTGFMLKFVHGSFCHASVMCLGGPPWPLRSRKKCCVCRALGAYFSV